jgi:hypothetical protein
MQKRSLRIRMDLDFDNFGDAKRQEFLQDLSLLSGTFSVAMLLQGMLLLQGLPRSV